MWPSPRVPDPTATSLRERPCPDARPPSRETLVNSSTNFDSENSARGRFAAINTRFHEAGTVGFSLRYYRRGAKSTGFAASGHTTYSAGHGEVGWRTHGVLQP